jgi:hypothetical protein
LVTKICKFLRPKRTWGIQISDPVTISVQEAASKVDCSGK